MALNTDKIMRVTTGSAPVTTSLSAGKVVGAPSISCSALVGWDTTLAVPVIIYKVDAAGKKIVTTQTEWIGTVSGTTISNLVLTYGTDQIYNSGDVVASAATGAWAYRLGDALLSSHNPDGTLKANAVDNAAVLASNVVTTAKILDANVTTAKLEDNSVTAPKLATNAISLGYGSSTTNTLGATGAAVAITGLSVAVTIPAGGRKVRITVYCPSVYNNSIANTAIYIFDGTVTAGTILNQGSFTSAGGNYVSAMTVSAIATPAAGAKTYTAGINTSAGTGGNNIGAGTSYILVEAI